MLRKIWHYFEVRYGFNEVVRSQLTEYYVPRNINIFYALGFIAAFAFVLQVVTGAFLLIYYIPHSDHAFKSVQDIMDVVPYGWFIRLLHVVGSNIMIAAVILHMVSVFFMGTYKKPREITWVTGFLLLLISLGLGLSGYLLPWSQLSYWATTIATYMPTAFPYVGNQIMELMRGGTQVTGITLNRFFAFHVAFLPMLAALLIAFHFFLVRRTGISSPPFKGHEEEKRPWDRYWHESHPGGYPFYPYFVVKELYVTMFTFALIFFVIAFVPGLFLPEDVNIPADPFKTPAHIKPEWYFLAPYQLLRIIPNKFLGITLQVIIVLILLFWPYLDTKEEQNILRRPVLLTVFILSIIAWIILTIWGQLA